MQDDSSYDDVEPAAIDWPALEARCLGNLDLVERVAARFARQLDGDLAALECAIRSGDAPAAAQFAHRIKGMSANMEARRLKERAAAAEELALAARLDELGECLTQLQRDRRLVAKALARNSL